MAAVHVGGREMLVSAEETISLSNAEPDVMHRSGAYSNLRKKIVKQILIHPTWKALPTNARRFSFQFIFPNNPQGNLEQQERLWRHQKLCYFVEKRRSIGYIEHMGQRIDYETPRESPRT